MNFQGLPIPIIVALIALAGATAGWFGRGLAFLLRRWWTGSPKQEHAAYLNSVADLAAKMRAHGMTLDDIQSLEAVMRSPMIASTAGAQAVVVELAKPSEPAAFESNYAMKMRTGASIAAAEGRLRQAIVDLDLLIRDDERELFEKAQQTWEAYRTALRDRAYQEYAGGTHAGLAAGLVALGETERREREIRAEVDERARR